MRHVAPVPRRVTWAPPVGVKRISPNVVSICVTLNVMPEQVVPATPVAVLEIRNTPGSAPTTAHAESPPSWLQAGVSVMPR